MGEELEDRQLTQEEVDAHLYVYGKSIGLKNAIERLSKNKDFKLLKKSFVEDYVLNKLNDVHSYKPESRERVAELYFARSVFVGFLQEAVEQGMKDEINLKDFKEMLELEQKNGDEE